MVNSKNHVRNPLNSRKLFLPASCTFFGSIYSFFLMSNKNLSYLLSNITYGVANSKNHVRNPLNSRKHFCRLAVLFLVGSIPSFWWAIRIWVVCFLTSHRGWPTAKIMYEILWTLGNFFCRLAVLFLVYLFLPSDEQLEFELFAFKHHIGGGQQQKSCTFFGSIYSFFLMSNKNLN